MKAIDIHAHIISEETVRLMQKEAPKVGPRITAVDADTAVYEVAGVAYRPFPRGGYDLERRLKDMAASDVDMQAVVHAVASLSGQTSAAALRAKRAPATKSHAGQKRPVARYHSARMAATATRPSSRGSMRTSPTISATWRSALSP